MDDARTPSVGRETVLEPAPVDPSLLVSANWWFDVSWYGLLIAGCITTFAAAATVIFLFIQYWSSGVRERHAEWRTSALELQTAQANSRASEANQKAKEAELALERFKAPRTIIEAQAFNFVKEASKYSGARADVWIIGDNPEPIGIGQIILVLLEKAGWTTAYWNWTGAGALTGVGIAVKNGSDADVDKTATFLVNALNSFGIASFRLNWGIDWDKFPGMLNGPPFSGDKAAPIRIVIGTKPQQ